MTFRIITRGTPTATTIADYECPVHGRFEAQVARTPAGDAPDAIPCDVCAGPAEWRISSPMCRVRRIEAIKGRSQKPERETWTDTRNIAEGQPVYDWHEDRAAVWERKRQRDVVAFAREHNERIRSDD